jgi:excisionase family DNA binding protein
MEHLEPILVDTKTACSLLSCGRTTLFKLINQNAIQRKKLGSKTLITLASIKALAKVGVV